MQKSDRRILIVGNAKTGTSALFFKIKNSLPDDSRCIFEPSSFLEQEDDIWRHVLAKVLIGNNDVDMDSFGSFAKRILLVRDPRDRLISLLLYSAYSRRDDAAFIAGLTDLLEKKESDPMSVSVREIQQFVFRENRGPILRGKPPINHIMDFARAERDAFILRYEDFIDGDLQRLEEYLSFRLDGPAEVTGALSRVKRTAAYGDWRHWFTPEDADHFRTAFIGYMRFFGYEDEWRLSENPEIRHEHASGYVRKMSNGLMPIGSNCQISSQAPC